MYGPVFESMFTGSMYGAGSTVFAVMTYAIAACDKDGKLEINPDLLAGMIGCDPEDITTALGVLQDVDPRSRNDELDGIRLAHVDSFEYRVVNYRFYQELAKARNKQERDRIRMKLKRDAERAEKVTTNNTVANSRQQSLRVVHSKTVDDKTIDDREHHIVVLAEILDHWNSKPQLPSVNSDTILKPTSANGKKRRSAALARITENPTADDWRTVIDRIVARPYCTGENDSGWRADIGYLFGVETFDNHMTGKFSKPKPAWSGSENTDTDVERQRRTDEIEDKYVAGEITIEERNAALKEVGEWLRSLT